jgi:hypothetical protein
VTQADSLDLQARAHITDLVYRYAQIIRNGNVEACATLFTAEATFEVREAIAGNPDSVRTRSKLAGRDAIVKYVRQSASSGSVCPLIHNLLIHIEGQGATSNSVMTAMIWASGKTMIGEYHDVFMYEDAWRFASRTYTILRAPESQT